MNILFEEDGAFRSGTVLADNVQSLQVETASGKRVKVKAGHVLLRYASPAPRELLEQAEREAADIEIDFLWQVCGEEEFTFVDLAREYYGHPPAAVEATAILLRLQAAPMHFHRKGKGRFRKAPADILQAALAGQEKKRQQALAIERMAGQLRSGQLPDEFAAQLPALLYKPDRNRPETKALELACAESGQSAPALLMNCGAIASSHDYHFGRFLFEHFPRGSEFPEFELPSRPDALPLAEVAAFSIDDATTTEIDDAFSVRPRAAGGWQIGIHIALPGYFIAPDSPLGRIARERLSTVYLPGRKLTMLPTAVVDAYTLKAGRACPALSLYLQIDQDHQLLSHHSQVEQVRMARNLHLHELEAPFNAAVAGGADGTGGADFPHREELLVLWQFASARERVRGKAASTALYAEYSFEVDWQPPEGRVRIVERPRGAPLDKLVSELMILANSLWGRQLADAGVAALYRVQNGGKVRMSTLAQAHEGLGVDCYAWASSPLRRYVDLLNQWQLLALLEDRAPPFAAGADELLAALRDFELTYAAYAEFQRGMERYWCLRWLQQEDLRETTARVVREKLVRLDRLPLVLACPSLPELAPQAPLRVELGDIDLLANTLSCRYRANLAADTVGDAVPE